MADRNYIRLRVLADGSVAITDPDPDAVELIRVFDPSFAVRTAPLPGFSRPRLLGTRATGSGIHVNRLPEVSDAQLWAAHDGVAIRTSTDAGEASLLDVKIELATRMLRHCELCALRCGVDRLRGEPGRCGLGAEAFVYEAYTHIAEEPAINPALNISLRGCGMRCVFCQQAGALDPHGRTSERLRPGFWEQLDLSQARSLVFVGGNPTESLPAILAFLKAAPTDFPAPIGWNSSGYDGVEAIRLLAGICDVFIPDLKYGNDDCAVTMSEAPGYVENALAAVEQMSRQGVPIYVRVLVLPGHEKCCHQPALAALARLPGKDVLQVSLQATYLPEWRAMSSNSRLSRRPTTDEVDSVRQAAQVLGLHVIA